MRQFEYVIGDEAGIHARPAGLLVREAKKYDSKITVSKGDKSASATGLMALMGLGVKCGDRVCVRAEGGDEAAAYEGLRAFFEENF